MESGFDSIKLLVIVLVVAVQGIAAFRGWIRKQRQRRQEEEARLGYPNRSGLPSDESAQTAPASYELPDWDPLGDAEDEPAKPDRPSQDRIPTTIVFPPVGSTIPAPALPPVADKPSVSAPATPKSIKAAALHKLPDPPKFNKAVRARLPGNATLRSAMIAKMVLDRPLSARSSTGPFGRQ